MHKYHPEPPCWERFGYPSGGGGGGGGSGTVTSVAATDASVVIGGTPTIAPTVTTGDLAAITGAHATSGVWGNNSKRITALAASVSASDAARYDATLKGLASAAGDILIATGANAVSKLAIGAANTWLGVNAGLPAWTALVSGRVTDTTGDKTTTSTSFVDLPNATLTLVTGARRCLVVLSGFGGDGTTGKYCRFNVVIDGVGQGGTYGITANRGASASQDMNNSFTFVTDVLSAGSHTIKIQWSVDAGTGTFYASATAPLVFSVIELPNT